MALPTLEKTWEHKVNLPALNSGSTLSNHQHYLWTVKEALVNGAGVAGSFTTPWTVWGSSDSSAVGNNDGVDRWVAYTNVVFNTGSNPHAWIVLKQTAIHSNFQVCIEANGASTGREFTFVVSPTAGFGIAAGGTDGSTTARPTATDEQVLINVGASGVQLSAWDGYYHVLMSADGECTRMVLTRIASGTPYTTAFWMMGKPMTPISPWTNPSYFVALGSTTVTEHLIRYVSLNDAANVKARIGTDDVSFYCTSEMCISSMLGELITVPDDQTGEWPMLPMGLACQTTGHQGVRKGTIYDLWWASTGTNHGDSYPDNATYQFAQLGEMIFPWNGTAPES